MALGGSIDGMIVAVTHGDVDQRHVDGGDALCGSKPVDLLRCQLGHLARHHHGEAERAAIGDLPFVQEIIVEGRAERRTLIWPGQGHGEGGCL